AQSLRLEPGYVEAHRNLGNLRLSQGRLDETLACYEQAVRLRPNSPTAHCELGRVLQELGNFERSEEEFRTALRLDPGNAEALVALTTQKNGTLSAADRAVIEQRLTDPGLKDYERGLILFTLAQLCDARSEYQQAADHLR